MDVHQKALDYYIFILVLLLQIPLLFIFKSLVIDSIEALLLSGAFILLINVLLLTSLFTHKGYVGPSNLLQIIQLKKDSLIFDRIKFNDAIEKIKFKPYAVNLTIIDFFGMFFWGFLFVSLFLLWVAVYDLLNTINETLAIIFHFIVMAVIFVIFEKLGKTLSFKSVLLSFYILLQESTLFLKLVFFYTLILFIGGPTLIMFLFLSPTSLTPNFIIDFFGMLYLLALLSIFVELFIYLGIKYGLRGGAFALLFCILAIYFQSNSTIFFGLILFASIILHKLCESSPKSVLMSVIQIVFIFGLYFKMPLLLLTVSILLLPISLIYVWLKRDEVILC